MKNKDIKDDNKDLITIDYYDRIHKQWIKVDVTREVAKFMKADEQQTRRKQNQYDYHNIPLSHFEREDNDYTFDVIDEESDIDKQLEKETLKEIADMQEDYERTLIENSLYVLTPEQREVIEMTMYKNMSYSEIAKKLNISKAAIAKRMKNALKKIKKHIESNQN